MVYSIRHSSRHDSKIPLKLVYIGCNHELELSNHPNGAGFCMWYTCTEGKGEFTVDGKRVILRPGQCVILLPETPFSCKALPGGCVIHLLGFTGPCCIELLRVFGIKESGIYQVSDKSILPETMERLVRMHRQNAAPEEYSKVCYGLLLDLAPASSVFPTSRPKPRSTRRSKGSWNTSRPTTGSPSAWTRWPTRST